MMRLLLRLAAAMLACIGATAAHAAVSCSVGAGAINHAYDPTLGTTTVVAASFTVTCTRGLAGDPNSVNFSVTVDNGLNPQGVNNRATMGGSTIRYDTFTNIGCTTKWKGATAITGSVAMPTTGTFSTSRTYYMCMTAGIAAAAGTYADSVLMTMNYGPGAGINTNGTIAISIATPAVCSLTSAAPSMTFDYTAFGPALNPSVSFGVTCTLYLNYTMALDATAGTAVGLAYSLALSTASSTGTGLQQLHAVNGTMAAGQAGTCGGAVCSATQVRTITLTY